MVVAPCYAVVMFTAMALVTDEKVVALMTCDRSGIHRAVSSSRPAA